jgi:hypothetical protein
MHLSKRDLILFSIIACLYALGVALCFFGIKDVALRRQLFRRNRWALLLLLLLFLADLIFS